MVDNNMYINLPGEERDPKISPSSSEPILVNAAVEAYLFSYLKLVIRQIVSPTGFRYHGDKCEPEHCDPYDKSDVPYYMPHFCHYSTCSGHYGCNPTDVAYNGCPANKVETVEKEVEIFTGKRYSITFFNEGFYNKVTGIVNGIYADPNEVMSGYINFTAFDSKCVNPLACTNGAKMSIGIGNIQDVEEIVSNPTSDDTYDEGEVKVVILGITATTIRSFVIRLGLISDDPDTATVYVDLTTGKSYHIVFYKDKSIYELDGKLVNIKPFYNMDATSSKQFVRGDYIEEGFAKYPGCGLYDPKYNHNSCAGNKHYPDMPQYSVPGIDYTVENTGMYNIPYEIASDQDAFLNGDKNNITDVELTFDTGMDGYSCLETVRLSMLRNCCLVDDCPAPPVLPPLDPFMNAFTYTVVAHELKFTGKNIDKVVIIKGDQDKYNILNDDIINTITDVEDDEEYTYAFENDGIFTLAVYYRCVCPIEFYNVVVDGDNTSTNTDSKLLDVITDGNTVTFDLRALMSIHVYKYSSCLLADVYTGTIGEPVTTYTPVTFDEDGNVVSVNEDINFVTTLDAGKYSYMAFPFIINKDNKISPSGRSIIGDFSLIIEDNTEEIPPVDDSTT